MVLQCGRAGTTRTRTGGIRGLPFPAAVIATGLPAAFAGDLATDLAGLAAAVRFANGRGFAAIFPRTTALLDVFTG
jgi:hypothetical protein